MAAHTLKKRKLNDELNSAGSGAGSGAGAGAGSRADTGADTSPYESESNGLEETEVSKPPSALRGRSRSSGASLDLKDASTSDMFQLQSQELLGDIQLRGEKRMARIEVLLSKLQAIIEDLPDQEPLSINEAEESLRSHGSVCIPFPHPKPQADAKYKLAFSRPVEVQAAGTFAMGLCLKSEQPLIIDLAVTMPSSLFQEKDYLNYRYFYKRAYFLAYVANGLKTASGSSFDVSYALHDQNQLQPSIIVSSAGGINDEFAASKCQVRIILALQAATFPDQRLQPWRSCLRAKLGTSLSSQVSTPMYNSTLQAEAKLSSLLQMIREASQRSAEFRQGCILSSIWLRQRGFTTELPCGGFGTIEVAAMMSLLLSGGGPKSRPILSSGYSSHQLFRALLQYLASHNLIEEPAVVGSLSSEERKSLRGKMPIFFDASNGLNILYKMTPWSYQKLQQEARSTLKYLETSVYDKFRPCFIMKADRRIYRFDLLIRISLSNQLSSQPVDGTDHLLSLCSRIHNILSKGLGNRASSIEPQAHGIDPWSTVSEGNSARNATVMVGLVLSAEHSTRLVDHGPSAEDSKAASSFRKFWGEKAELRRFKDGSILESLIWNDLGGEHSVVQQIVLHVLDRHLGQGTSDWVEFVSNDLQQRLTAGTTSRRLLAAPFESNIKTYEQLADAIRKLEDLPLQVRQISASSSGLHYSSMGPSDHPMDIIIQFEGSARWPDELGAIERTKIAFLYKLGELLEISDSDIQTKLGLENQTESRRNASYLDIVYRHGACFRLRIYHGRELTLLERQLKDRSQSSQVREEISRAITAHKRTFVHSPLHSQMLRTLCIRFPVLSPTIRLLKLWCAAHLLSNHLTPEFLELFAVQSFTTPYPWSTPGSVRTGFLRTLAALARWDWHSEPFVVDFNGELTPHDIQRSHTLFAAWRKIDPAMNRHALFVASSHDPEGLIWTSAQPSKVVAARLTALARAACHMVNEEDVNAELDALFVPSLESYDFVLHLDPKYSRGGAPGTAKGAVVFKNLPADTPAATTAAHDVHLVGYAPAQLFLDELERLHRGNVVFFYDAAASAAGGVIAGLWNPQHRERPWKLNLPYSTMPAVDFEEGEEEARVEVNRPAVLHDVARLGGDLIRRIDVRKSK